MASVLQVQLAWVRLVKAIQAREQRQEIPSEVQAPFWPSQAHHTRPAGTGHAREIPRTAEERGQGREPRDTRKRRREDGEGRRKYSRLLGAHPKGGAQTAGRREGADHFLRTEDEEATLRALSSSLAPATMAGYNTNLKKFFDYCDDRKIPPALRLPASESLLCAFAASLAGKYAHTTANNHISAIRAWHIMQDVPWSGGKRLQYILNGVRQEAPPSKPARPPVTREMLEALHTHLSPEIPLHAAVLGAADTAFWAQARLGELLNKEENQFDAKTTLKREDLRAPSQDNDTVTLNFPFTKTKGFAGDKAIITRQRGASDPIHALRTHLTINPVPGHLPLFSFRTEDRWKCLTKTRFLRVCNEVWSQAGFQHTTGHSFRIGGTTELLTKGVDPEVVKAMGRWSSDAFLRYWRNLETVVPLHAAWLPTTGEERNAKRRKIASAKKKRVTFQLD